MKTISFLFLIFPVLFFMNFNANTPDPSFEELWSEVEDLQKKGQPRSALKTVEQIIILAREVSDDEQLIKAIQYKYIFVAQIEENGELKGFEFLLKQLEEEQSEVVKSLVRYTYASHLKNYVSNNFYRLENRTSASDAKKDDIASWSIVQIENEIDAQIDSILNAKDVLLTEDIESFSAVIDSGQNSLHLMPSLYEFLAHQIISQFAQRNRYGIEAIIESPISFEDQFIRFDEYAQLDFEGYSDDENNLKILRIYQELIQFQKDKENKDPFLFTELSRLEFLYQKSNQNLPGTYEDLLRDLLKNHQSAGELALVYHSIGEFYQSLANSAEDKSEGGMWNKKAHRMYSAGFRGRPATYGGQLCGAAIHNLERPTLNFQVEHVLPIGRENLIKIDHKEVDQVKLEIGKLRLEDFYRYQSDYKYRQKIDRIFREAANVQFREITLNNQNDYQSYSSEIMIDALEPGAYIVHIYNKEKNLDAWQFVQVSDLNFAYTSHGDETAEIIVMNRWTGSPVSGVSVKLYNSREQLQSPSQVPFNESLTDKNGIVKVIGDRYRSFRVILEKDDDHLYSNDHIYPGRFSNDRPQNQVSIFTDRAIYRPGQDIHFKAIAYQKDIERIPSLLTYKDLTVELVNPNGKVEETMELVTNEFGSVSGVFKAPTFGLKGQFYIRCQSFGSVGIRIEEYKRPKFKVELNNPEGELKPGVNIIVEGNAESFAGTAIADAKISYAVTRRKEYRYFWYFDYGYRPRNNDEKLIAQGTGQTDEEGIFNIEFKSQEADVNERQWGAIDIYEVKVDVTDVNGETRSSSSTVRVGHEPYYIGSNVPAKISAENFNSISLTCQNAMGNSMEADVELEIVSLIAPTNPKISKSWGQVDFPVANEKAFNSSFPYYKYEGTPSYKDWEVNEVLEWRNVKIDGASIIEFEDKPLPAVYRVTVKDQNGIQKYQHYVSVYDFDKANFPGQEILRYATNQSSYQPGEEVQLMISGLFTGDILIQVEKDKNIISQKWERLDKTQTIKVPVEESDRGGFVIRILHGSHNRFATYQVNVSVPWTNKELDIEWETFRDNLLPGQDETWTMVIKGSKKEAVAAEVLAGMYDASLDEFVPHNWYFNVYPTYYSQGYIRMGRGGIAYGDSRYQGDAFFKMDIQRQMPRWQYLDHYGYRNVVAKSAGMGRARLEANSMMMDESAENEEVRVLPPAMAEPPAPAGTEDTESQDEGAKPESSELDFAPRVNLNETVFFMPNLRTDSEGNVKLEFTMNEALTSWKVQLMAHTTDLQSGISSQEVKTQKDLMVFPQIPRFLREGDTAVIKAKINRLVDTTINGLVSIEIRDANNGRDLTSTLVKDATHSFEIADAKQTTASWKLIVPVGMIQPIEIVVKAAAGKHTDGELNVIPVLTNRMLITEALPLQVRAGQTKKWHFDRLDDMRSNGKHPHRLTLEYMENPVWFAVQSLPYLQEYPHECTEQLAHRIYANAIASHIIEQYPKIQKIFNQWQDADALISNLNKNQELKSALIEETPWLRQAESEEQQMANIALLFDYNRMANELDEGIEKLISRQLSNGGFVWFSGGYANGYVTRLVVEIFGHLRSLGIDVPASEKWFPAVERAKVYIVNEMDERYDKMTEKQKEAYTIDASIVHSIYVMSFFIEEERPSTKAWKFFYDKAKEHWLETALYQQALLATGVYRFGEEEFTRKVVASVKDKALRSDELGMYFKYDNNYWWYSRPIETHAHIMEAISLVDEDVSDINEMRIWLLKHKQTNRWNTTVSTAKAIYALLLRGDDWMKEMQPVDIKIGDEILSSTEKGRPDDALAGTGYFKRSWEASEIDESMENVEVSNPNEIISWGALYWQYFQDIDKVEAHDENPLKIKRALYKKVRTNSGEQLIPVDGGAINIGDKITVRLEVSVDRMMEFIHLKDVRAAGLEPVDVLSKYQWKGGLGYYQSTTDLGTHFFIDRIQVGTYVLEYDAFAVNAGQYSSGLSTLQCMYAPEFTSHSSGRKLEITE